MGTCLYKSFSLFKNVHIGRNATIRVVTIVIKEMPKGSATLGNSVKVSATNHSERYFGDK